MDHKQIFQEFALCRLKGVMFHDEMTDYYAYLHCEKFKQLHCKEMNNDLTDVHNIKDYYLTTYKQLLKIDYSDAKIDTVIPGEWNKYNLTEPDRIKFVKHGLVIYYEWEVKVKKHLEELLDELFSLRQYEDYNYLKNYLKETILEIAHIEDLQRYVDKLNYNIDNDEGLVYKLN